MSLGEIWNYFQKLDDHFVTCLICGIKLRKAANRSTKTFWTHMSHVHPQVYSQTDRAKIGEFNTTSMTPPENFLDEAEESTLDGAIKNEPVDVEQDGSYSVVNLQNQFNPSMSSNIPDIQVYNSMLISEVCKYPALFDFNHELYKNQVERQKCWERVAVAMKRNVEFVRVRWKTLRDRFKKEQNRIKTNDLSPTQILWPHYQEMLFILPFVKDKPDNPQRTDNSHFDELYEESSHLAEEPLKSTTSSLLDFANNMMKNQEQLNDYAQPGAETSSAYDTNQEKYDPHQQNSSRSTPISYQNSQMSSVQQPQTNFIVRVTKRDHNQMNYSESTYQDHHSGYYPHPPKQNKLPSLEEDDQDDEDSLFCKIIMKKLKKMDEHMKERAKAKILETLVQVQYG